MGLEQYSNRDL